MSIISVKDDKNNRWKSNSKTKNKTNKHKKYRARVTEGTARGWEINDFVARLS